MILLLLFWCGPLSLCFWNKGGRMRNWHWRQRSEEYYFLGLSGNTFIVLDSSGCHFILWRFCSDLFLIRCMLLAVSFGFIICIWDQKSRKCILHHITVELLFIRREGEETCESCNNDDQTAKKLPAPFAVHEDATSSPGTGGCGQEREPRLPEGGQVRA